MKTIDSNTQLNMDDFYLNDTKYDKPKKKKKKVKKRHKKDKDKKSKNENLSKLIRKKGLPEVNINISDDTINKIISTGHKIASIFRGHKDNNKNNTQIKK